MAALVELGAHDDSARHAHAMPVLAQLRASLLVTPAPEERRWGVCYAAAAVLANIAQRVLGSEALVQERDDRAVVRAAAAPTLLSLGPESAVAVLGGPATRRGQLRQPRRRRCARAPQHRSRLHRGADRRPRFFRAVPAAPAFPPRCHHATGLARRPRSPLAARCCGRPRGWRATGGRCGQHRRRGPTASAGRRVHRRRRDGAGCGVAGRATLAIARALPSWRAVCKRDGAAATECRGHPDNARRGCDARGSRVPIPTTPGSSPRRRWRVPLASAMQSIDVGR